MVFEEIASSWHLPIVLTVQVPADILDTVVL